MKKRGLILILFCSSNLSFAYSMADLEISGKVSSVLDGNTLEIIDNNKDTYKITLFGIDCPELDQDYGVEAKKALEKLVLKKNVIAYLKGRDRSGQYIAEVFMDDKKDIRIYLLDKGLAWTSEKNPLSQLEKYKTKAQKKGKGLWKQSAPIPPWMFRREQSMLQPKSN